MLDGVQTGEAIPYATRREAARAMFLEIENLEDSEDPKSDTYWYSTTKNPFVFKVRYHEEYLIIGAGIQILVSGPNARQASEEVSDMFEEREW